MIKFTLTAESNIILTTRSSVRTMVTGDVYHFGENVTSEFQVAAATDKDVKLEMNMRQHRFEMNGNPAELTRT